MMAQGPTDKSATKRTAALVSLFLVLMVGIYFAWHQASPESGKTLAPKGAPSSALSQDKRLISLSPGVSDTIRELGRAPWLVGVSDYCVIPEEDGLENAIPQRVGSALTPNYEAIATLRPSLIITSQVAGEQLIPLSKIAQTKTLPWLTLDEWTSSILQLGKLIDSQQSAIELASTITTTLQIEPKADAPRVLLALDYGDSGSNETWFIRKNSIHGSLLRSAGAQNAVPTKIKGQPKLSPEELLAIDPDGIIVLRDATPNDGEEKRSLAPYFKWTPLTAVKNHRLAVLSKKGSLAISPQLMQLVPELRALIDELFPRETQIPESGKAIEYKSSGEQ